MQNVFRARETTFNSITALVLAVVGGLPTEAIALKITISMTFGLLLDVPLGVLADRLGHARAVTIGMHCLAIAPIILLVPCVYTLPYEATILFVIANALAGSFGSSFVSGAYEALTLGLVESLNRSPLAQQLNRRYDATSVTSLQRYGSTITLVLPAAAIVVTLLLDRLWQVGYVTLIAPSLIAMGFTHILTFADDNEPKDQISNKSTTHLKLVTRFAGPIALVALTQFTMIHANAYTLVSAIDIEGIRHASWGSFYISAVMSCAFFAGFFVKAKFGHTLIESTTKSLLPIVCILCAFLLSALCFFINKLFESMFAVFVFGCFFRLFFSTAQEVISNSLLSDVGAEGRATVMSIARTIAVGGYAFFSASLLYRHDHIPTLNENLLSVALLCIFIATVLVGHHIQKSRRLRIGSSNSGQLDEG